MLDAGLSPSPEARSETRFGVTLDLTGLPPTIAEVDAFLADKSPECLGEAHRPVNDVALHYRRRMARRGSIRPASGTATIQTDDSRSVWAWRDWVASAQPQPAVRSVHDQATHERPAAERDAGPDHRDRLAAITGSMAKADASSRMNHPETVIDRVETTGWLRADPQLLSLPDHKYDPVSQRGSTSSSRSSIRFEEGGVLGRRAGGNTPPLLTIETEEHKAQLAAFEEAVKTFKQWLARGRSGCQGFVTALSE